MMAQFVGAELRRQNVGPEFFQTGMGKMFYDSTMPQLVKEVRRLAEVMEAVGRELEELRAELRARPAGRRVRGRRRSQGSGF